MLALVGGLPGLGTALLWLGGGLPWFGWGVGGGTPRRIVFKTRIEAPLPQVDEISQRISCLDLESSPPSPAPCHYPSAAPCRCPSPHPQPLV